MLFYFFYFFFVFIFFWIPRGKHLQQLLFSFHFPFLLSTLTTATQTPAQDTPSIQQWNNSSNITNLQSVNTHPLLNSFYNEFQSERKFNCRSAIGPVGPPDITLLTASIFFTAVWRRQQIWVSYINSCALRARSNPIAVRVIPTMPLIRRATKCPALR